MRLLTQAASRAAMLCASAISACVLLWSASAAAQTYPDKPLRLVVPYPPGGSLDTTARLLGKKLSDSMKQPVIIENKTGAGGNIGADFVAKSAPDGYTILIGAVATHAINPSLYPKMPYDAQKDFAPITQIASTPNVLIVHPSVPVTDIKSFIAYLKANPNKLSFGSGSNGSAGHLAGELFKAETGTQMVHVPYKGAGPAMQALLANEVQVLFDNLANAMPQIKAGKVKALGITTRERSPMAKELPTIAEAAIPGFDISTWIGAFVPAGTPKPIQQRLHKEFVDALAAADVRERMANIGADPVGDKPEEFAAYIKSETEKYAKIIKASGAKVD
jgi:tripartite-type tricarboxylate transporter receptor subunit TctC